MSRKRTAGAAQQAIEAALAAAFTSPSNPTAWNVLRHLAIIAARAQDALTEMEQREAIDTLRRILARIDGEK